MGYDRAAPISPILFALVMDPLLLSISSILVGNGVVRAYADDIAMVIFNWANSAVAGNNCVQAQGKLFDVYGT